jgi:hypothetical protein
METKEETKVTRYYLEKCKKCGKEVKGTTKDQVRWLLNVHKMTHEKKEKEKNGL